MGKNKGLGKGLGALLGDYSEPVAETGGVRTLPLQKVEPNASQPRTVFDEEALDALAASIEKVGIIQPLTVRETDGGFYQIIAGERRWRAARLLGLKEVPVVIVKADDKEAMELALIENLQRQDLNPMEEANGYQSLIDDYGLTQEEAAARVGKSRPAVANALRLLTLEPSVRQHLIDGTLSAGHGRAIAGLKDPALQKTAAQRILALSLSVRQAESMCKKMAKPKPEEPEPEPLAVDYVADCEKSLSRRLGRGVRIVNGKRKGRFELDFYGQDDLQALLEALQTLHLKE